MAKRHKNAEDIMEAGPAKRIKLDVGLQYLYDFERDGTSELVNQAQQLQVPYYDGDKWDSKYNLLEPKELQKFASNIYNNYEKKPSQIELECTWKLLYCVRGTVLDVKSAGLKGFYGELYFNSDKHCLLLAVKGTSSWGNGWSDLKNVLLNFQGGEIDSALTFGEKVREMIMNFKCKPMLMITGHSLGGYLAQIITYTLKYCYLDKDGKLKSRETPCDDLKIYTVVFDSPAAINQIISIDQRDPIRPEILLLPIVNFIVDVNIINSNSVVGPHLGQVVAVKSFQDLNTPSKWKRMRNARSFHGIKIFKDINFDEFRQVEYLADKKSIKFDAKAIPSCMLSVINFERLHKYLFLADMCAELANKLPKFKLSNSRIVVEDETVSIEEFIPRVHHFLAQYKDQLDSGKFDGKQIIDMVAFNLWRVGMLKDAHGLSLNEEWKRIIDKWQDGNKIGGFESHEEMRFVGCLLHNTIPRCVHYNYEDFISLDCDVKDNFLATTKGVLVLIVKHENQIDKQLYEKLKQVKIFYLILDFANKSKINLLKFCALDEESQDKLKNKEVKFMGNEVCASLVFGNKLLENLRVSSNYCFHVKSALKDDFFYCDQKIVSDNEKYKFKSATEFAHELSKEKLKFVLIASDAGMGKSTALKQIAKTLQNQRQNYWIVYLNLFSIQTELYATKEKLITLAAAIEIVRNAALAERREDEVLKKVFDWKVEAKEMVLCLDSLDEICPNHRETANILLKFLRETELQIVVTSRPHEGKNFKDAQIFSVAPIKYRDRDKFVTQKCKMMGKLPPSDIESWFDKIFNEHYDNDFWGVPLILNMAINIFDPSEALEAVIDKIQKTNIFEAFINKSISNTLEIKMNLHKSLASGFYSEKCDLYSNLIQILAICTIFHLGEVALDFQKEIEKHRDFIKRFDMAKVDDCNKVAFLHRSFAEYLVARLFVQNQQAKAVEKILDDNQLKCILFDAEFCDTRKHICTILAMNSPKSTSFSGCIINGEETLLLKILIEEDRYELYMAFKDLLCSQLNKKMMVRIRFENVKTSPLYYALNEAREEFVQQLISDGAQFEAILCEERVLHSAIEKGLYKEVINHFESLKSDINVRRYRDPQTPLEIAAKKGSREMVEFLIKKEADVNAADNYFDHSALYYAIEANSADIIALLIAKKAVSAKALMWATQLNRKEMFDIIYEKYTPSKYKVERLRESLFYAVRYGDLESVKHLNDFPEAQLTMREVKENVTTIWHVAAENGNLHCMDFIFEYMQPHCQSINVRDEDGQTPLLRAIICCEDNCVETVEWLLKKNADVKAVDNTGMSCLHYAAYTSEKCIVEILLNDEYDINLKDDKGWTPLFYALGEEHSDNSDDMLKYLLERSADVNIRDIKGNTCLHFAGKFGKSEAVELLVKHLPVNCENDDGETPLHLAARRGHTDTVEFLLKSGADINLKDKRGLTTLLHASSNENNWSEADVVKYLLDNSADVNVRDIEGNTCLHFASKVGNLEDVELLVKHLPVNCVNDDGETPLHLAALMGRKDTVEFLLNAGADINWKDKEGWTTLFFASCNEKNGSKADLLKYLLENTSADINLRSNEGSTCLHIASNFGNLDAVELLVKHLPVNCVDDDGETPLHRAASMGRNDTVEFLLNAGAEINLKDKRGRTPLF